MIFLDANAFYSYIGRCNLGLIESTHVNEAKLSKYFDSIREKSLPTSVFIEIMVHFRDNSSRLREILEFRLRKGLPLFNNIPDYCISEDEITSIHFMDDFSLKKYAYKLLDEKIGVESRFAYLYGMKRINDDVFIFVTYHKEESTGDKSYVEGKPDYADAFEDHMMFRWDSQMGRGIDSSYVNDVVTASRKHLLVKKSDVESNFYYLGQFDIVDVRPAKKKDNHGRERDIAKFRMRMHHSVREDLLRYLQSSMKEKEDVKAG